MKKAFFRLLVALLALVAAGAAGYYAFTLEQRASALRNAERSFGEDVLRLQASLAELRAAQAGYLAAGQDAAIWIQKAAQLRQQADTQLKRILAASPGPEVEAELATVAEALAALARFDTRITELLRDEQMLTASALIFSDSAQVVSAANATLSTVRGTRASKAGVAQSELRRRQIYAGAGAGVVVLAALLLLVPVRRGESQERGDEDAAPALISDTTLFAPVPPAPASHVGVGADLDLALDRRSSRSREVESAGQAREDLALGWSGAEEGKEERSLGDLDAPPRTPDPAPAPRRAATPSGESSDRAAASALSDDLSAAARLCTDFARVRETSELQGLLARAAALLDASGVVVWMGGSGGNVLWPAFSHGYTPHTLSKMQALPRDGGTPVSVAFRTGLMEVVPASDGAHSGAIVAPILASSGCVGVMAIEIRPGAERSDAKQALAGIIAAQLATLVAGDGTQ